jgi:hypothetical protein
VAKAENLPPLCADWDPQSPGTLTARTGTLFAFCHTILTSLFELPSSIWQNVSFGFFITVTSTGHFVMYSGITTFCYRKTVGHLFTKPVQVEETTKKKNSL